nr:collagen alpha-6(VI) chain-like [Biomphalaria glabrata]
MLWLLFICLSLLQIIMKDIFTAVQKNVNYTKDLTATEAKLARDSGIVMFAVGVGTNITNEELFNIAGDHSRQLADSGYTSERGARPNAKKVAVLVVSGVKSAELVSKQVKNLLGQGIKVFIADPTDSGVKIEGATTLKGQSLAQAEELIHYLCNPCQPTTSK